jgi:RNA polymerase sigma-70 factor (ECF subfamily)
VTRANFLAKAQQDGGAVTTRPEGVTVWPDFGRSGMRSYEPGLALELGTAATPVAPQATTESAPPCFGTIVREHSRYVLGLLRRLGVEPGDVDDVGQEVFLAIHAQLSAFEGRSSLKTWLCGICRHKAGDYRRKALRRRSLFNARPLEPEARFEDPQDGLLRKEGAELLHQALAKLPEEQLEVFVLYEIEELAMKDVAKAVGCPIDTAYTRHRVARQRVQAFFRRAALAWEQR